METDEKSLTKSSYEKKTMKVIQNDIINIKKKLNAFIFITLSFLFLFVLYFIKNASNINKINFCNQNKFGDKLITNSNNSSYIDCKYIENKLSNRIQPLDYEDEFIFLTQLISCNISFSFLRFADGENAIMKGNELRGIDKWHWKADNKNFRKSLIESVSICTNNNSFIAIPCKNWIQISNSILSFSNCTSSKYMSYATIFTNKNYKIFQDWVLRFINSSNRRKIILVANSVINKNINWAYKFFPVPTNLVDNWDSFSPSLLSKLSIIAKSDNLIFFVSAGPAANIIISYLSKINNKNIYIDFGSSIEFITKGYTTRSYSGKGFSSQKRCEKFLLQNKSLIYE